MSDLQAKLEEVYGLLASELSTGQNFPWTSNSYRKLAAAIEEVFACHASVATAEDLQERAERQGIGRQQGADIVQLNIARCLRD